MPRGDDLAGTYPAKLNEMQALFMSEAARYNMLPIDDRGIERVNPALAGRPDLMGSRTTLTLYEGMEGMMENTFHFRDGKPAYEYNWLGLRRYVVEGPAALAAGKATVKLDFAYDGGGLGKGGLAILFVNGTEVARGRIEQTQPLSFSLDETADVGPDNQTPVAAGIGHGPEQTKFTGRIDKVTVEVR